MQESRNAGQIDWLAKWGSENLLKIEIHWPENVYP